MKSLRVNCNCKKLYIYKENATAATATKRDYVYFGRSFKKYSIIFVFFLNIMFCSRYCKSCSSCSSDIKVCRKNILAQFKFRCTQGQHTRKPRTNQKIEREKETRKQGKLGIYLELQMIKKKSSSWFCCYLKSKSGYFLVSGLFSWNPEMD